MLVKERILKVLRRYSIYDRVYGTPVLASLVAKEILDALGEVRTVHGRGGDSDRAVEIIEVSSHRIPRKLRNSSAS